MTTNQIQGDHMTQELQAKPTPLPAIGQWSKTGLDLPESLTFEDWVEVGDKLRTVEQSVMWWIGDWLRFGERRYGEMYAQAVELTGYSEQTLTNAKWVSSKYEISNRLENLPWAHHQIAAALPALERANVLFLAAENGWSQRDVRTEITRRKCGLPSLVENSTASPPLPPTWSPRKFQRLEPLLRAAFQDWFGIGESGADLLMVLFNAGGQPLSRRAIAVRADSHRPQSDGAVYEAISQLRQSMETEAVDQSDGAYYLSEVGMGECRQAIREEARALMGIGAEPANDWQGPMVEEPKEAEPA